LSVGESFVLVTDHDPHHLRNEFDTDHPDSHGWEYLDQSPGTWRIQISKLATTPLPRVVCDTMTIIHHSQPEAGVAWKLPMNRRDLDSNIIRLAPGASIGAHVGPDLDVLLLILDGTGHLTTEVHTIDLHRGALIWLPQRSRRQFTAGPHGLSYLTVHQRRQSLVLNPAPPREH
jgi:quercetin dioxygenase-like cupin family protein